jgi:hypothetical protein
VRPIQSGVNQFFRGRAITPQFCAKCSSKVSEVDGGASVPVRIEEGKQTIIPSHKKFIQKESKET